MTSSTSTILGDAARLTSEDRQQSYGHPLDNFRRAVGMFNAQFRSKLVEPLTPADWGQIMIIAKVARLGHTVNPDTLTDVAGYARTIEMVIDETLRRKATEAEKNGVPAFLAKVNVGAGQ